MGGLLIVLGLIAMGGPFLLPSSGPASAEIANLDVLNAKTNLTIVGAALFVAGVMLVSRPAPASPTPPAPSLPMPPDAATGSLAETPPPLVARKSTAASTIAAISMIAVILILIVIASGTRLE